MAFDARAGALIGAFGTATLGSALDAGAELASGVAARGVAPGLGAVLAVGARGVPRAAVVAFPLVVAAGNSPPNVAASRGGCMESASAQPGFNGAGVGVSVSASGSVGAGTREKSISAGALDGAGRRVRSCM